MVSKRRGSGVASQSTFRRETTPAPGMWENGVSSYFELAEAKNELTPFSPGRARK